MSATPTTTGTIAAGNVRGRAASTQRGAARSLAHDAWETSKNRLAVFAKALRPSWPLRNVESMVGPANCWMPHAVLGRVEPPSASKAIGERVRI